MVTPSNRNILLSAKGKKVEINDKSMEEFNSGKFCRVSVDGSIMQLNLLFSTPNSFFEKLEERMINFIEMGPPAGNFLWPADHLYNSGRFGYITPLKPAGDISFMNYVTSPEIKFNKMAGIAFNIVSSLKSLHLKEMIYCDGFNRSITVDSEKASVSIMDVDKIFFLNETKNFGFLGTPELSAPEYITGKNDLNLYSARYSIAVILFYLFFRCHPLDGSQGTKIAGNDSHTFLKRYVESPLFVFDPYNDSNRPSPSTNKTALDCWNMYPGFLKDIFIRTFTTGINSPLSRASEDEWLDLIVKLKDMIIICRDCGTENFHDGYVPSPKLITEQICRKCSQKFGRHFKLRVDQNVIVLNEGTELFPHHIDKSRKFDFSYGISVVTRHPDFKDIYGLKNLTDQTWVATSADGTTAEVIKGRNISLKCGTKINFGTISGEIIV